ncbi:protein FAM83B [Aulostomus maculatus]
MESPQFSLLSSLRGEFKSEDYIQPHYKESYRLAIDHLVSGGRDGYQEFLKGERIGSFLSEEELDFIIANAKELPPQIHVEDFNGPADTQSSSGTYWPVHSDVVTPDLDLGWPEVVHERLQTNIDLLFHPPRLNNPTIKEVIRKNIQDARQVIAIVMDMFTDVDIFKETVSASVRGVPVYVLLDDSHLKDFLTMAENQDVKIQQLRNMRVRSVKGLDYICRSGATFHGAMEQRFLLVDCHTAIYGSYSFTWSFEKVNLSMVQVITGHLVKSYDEEFRTLYARSAVPDVLGQPDALFQPNGLHGHQSLLKCGSHSVQKLDRKDQLRHTLDTVYRKTCERKQGFRDLEDRLFENGSNNFGPLFENEMDVQNKMPQFQPAQTINVLKRHSYAGEKQDTYVPQNIRPKASQWNLSRDMGHGVSHHPMDNYRPQTYRGQNMGQPYNVGDKALLSMQPNIPTLENTSKSFMRSWRIESYLKNTDVPSGDSCDYLDQFEQQDKSSSFMQGRMRSSFVFRSTIPEQTEPNMHMNMTSAGVKPSVAPNAPLHYSSMQWNPAASAENRMNNEECKFKRPSLQGLNDLRNNTSYGQGRPSYQSVYSSLGRPKGAQTVTNPDILADSWQKRHSVADPRSNSEYTREPAGHMYGAFARMQVNRGTAGISAQGGGYGSNLKEDHRSVSHYDVKSVTDTKSSSTPIWQEPPTRAVSAAALDMDRQDLTTKSNRIGSQHFLKKSTKKIKSFLNIPGKKNESSMVIPAVSTDTLTAEDEDTLSEGGGNLHPTPSGSVRSSHMADDLKYSKPRFRTDDHQHQPQITSLKSVTQREPVAAHQNARPSLAMGRWSKDRGTEHRLYSRFEPFCSLDKKHTLLSAHSFGNTQSQNKSLTPTEHSLTRGVRAQHDNKFEKFIQRVGNLIHKNK